jgi:hypothetical protein
MARVYSSTSVATTLATTLTNIATSMTVTAGGGGPLIQGAGFANGDIFTIAIDPDTQTEEICYVTANSGDTFTISRGQAGTGTAGVSGVAHASGATVRHVLTSSDLIYFRDGVTTANAAIPASTLTTKGDLLTRTSASLARLGVGSNNQNLLADSTATNGIKWGDSATSVLTTTGDLLYASAANTLARKAIGATGDVLTVTGGVPVWADPVTPDTTLVISAKTADYTFIAGDINKLITMSSASTTTFTVPSGIFTVGQLINVQGIGAGTVQIRNNGTSSLTSTGATSTAPNLRAQYSAATIICTGSNTFTVIGDLA